MLVVDELRADDAGVRPVGLLDHHARRRDRAPRRRGRRAGTWRPRQFRACRWPPPRTRVGGEPAHERPWATARRSARSGRSRRRCRAPAPTAPGSPGSPATPERLRAMPARCPTSRRPRYRAGRPGELRLAVRPAWSAGSGLAPRSSLSGVSGRALGLSELGVPGCSRILVGRARVRGLRRAATSRRRVGPIRGTARRLGGLHRLHAAGRH